LLLVEAEMAEPQNLVLVVAGVVAVALHKVGFLLRLDLLQLLVALEEQHLMLD
jgi:hypothetical protein